MIPPVKGFIENTLIDWEGRIASIIFLPGCNFRCPYCHAGHLVAAPNELESIPFTSIAEFLQQHKGWIDGVVISGGEPVLHEGLHELAAHIRKLGVGVKLDTNGSSPETLSSMIDSDLVDCVAMDVKAPLNEKYAIATGTDCDLDAIGRSIEILMDSDIAYEFRTTVCPAFLGEDDVIEIAKAVRGAERLVLQQFKPDLSMDRSYRTIAPYSRQELKTFAERAAKYVKICFVRGEPTGEFTGALEGTLS